MGKCHWGHMDSLHSLRAARQGQWGQCQSGDDIL